MNYDKDMKVGDLVKVTLSSVRGEYDNGIVLGIIKDNTYKDIDRYYVQYYSFGKACHQSQWANHVKVVSKA
tara:strand:- start:9774 stop:9986 length:213 start_codon:yes stop_codon:yes gene_type:complete